VARARALAEAKADDLRSPVKINARVWEGVYVDEVIGALWSYAMIEASRCTPEEAPEYQQTVVAIVPSGASTPDPSAIDDRPKNDETGIVVGSVGADGRAYLRADLSTKGGPEVWGRSGNANTAAINFGQVLESADCIRCQGQLITASFWAKSAQRRQSRQ
jgi:phage terminase large subunit-like protein